MALLSALQAVRVGSLLLATVFLSWATQSILAANPTFEAAKVSVKDLKNPQTITIPANTVWYRCGLGSSKKIKFSVKSDVKLDTYIAAGSEDVKKINFESTPSAVSIDNVIAKAKYSYEGGTFCDQKTNCDKTVGGRLLLYDRCLAVSNVRSGGSPTTFTAAVDVENDNIVILIWVAIAVGIGLFILSIACCLCKVFTCCCCPTPCCCC